MAVRLDRRKKSSPASSMSRTMRWEGPWAWRSIAQERYSWPMTSATPSGGSRLQICAETALRQRCRSTLSPVRPEISITAVVVVAPVIIAVAVRTGARIIVAAIAAPVTTTVVAVGLAIAIIAVTGTAITVARVTGAII